MSRVGYFQQYAQRENHVTNNTMLLLRHIYVLGPERLSRVLSALMDDAQFTLGAVFEQQIRGTASVPDAAILQPALEIWIETKLGDDLDEDQIRRHLDHVADRARVGDRRFLIGLTRSNLPESRLDHFNALARELNVTFVGTTFENVVDAVAGELRPHEAEHLAILDDYASFLNRENLLLTDARSLAVFPCRTSERENIEYNLYYEPASRPRKRSSFVGLYARKTVTHIGRVESVVVCDWSTGTLSTAGEFGRITDAELARIESLVETTGYYDLKAEATRFYLTRKMHPTHISKITPNGIMGFRYLDLTKRVSDLDLRNVDVEVLAKRLEGWTFE